MLKPWFYIPPKLAHDLSPWALKILTKFYSPGIKSWKSFDWKGIHFANPLGIAGGVDKEGRSVPSWWSLGAGFVEIGTITPKAQGPNPGQILDRYVEHQAMWNKMGFPNKGCAEAMQTISRFHGERHSPIFLNIGKNRDTANSDAHNDYKELINKMSHLGDLFVINISSPNTKGLRDLQSAEELRSFLRPIIEENQLQKNRPLLVKLSPDMEEKDLKSTVDECIALGINGVILTNTTRQRPSQLPAPKEGGVSGKPLAEQSKKALQSVISHLGADKGDFLVVSVGGIMSYKDALERLEMGADLIQVYSALIYHGPHFFQTVNKQFEADMKEASQNNFQG